MKLRLSHLVLAFALATTSVHANVTLNLKDAEINTLISTVSEVTGKNFIVDPRVKGKVTVISSTPMSQAAVYQTFLAVLQVQGFAAVPAGNAIKIIPETNVRSDAGLLNRDGRGMPLDDVVTHVYALKNISAAQLVPILRPLVPQWGHLAAYPSNNMLVISDRAGNVARLNEIIKKMDNGSDRDVDTVALTNAGAGEVVRMVTAMIQQAKQADPTASTANVLADERTNSVLVMGEKGERNRLSAIIQRLDTPSKDDGATQVVYLRYASAENIAPLLEGYAKQVNSGAAAGTPAGTAPNTAATSAGGADGTRVIADKDTNALLITAQPKVMRQIKTVIDQLDIQRAQVMVEAIIAEVSDNQSSQLGLDFAAYNPRGGAIASILSSTTLAALTNIAATGNPLAGLGAIGQGVTAGGVSIQNDGRSGTSFGVILKALRNDGDTNVLSTPSLTTLDNEESEVSVGQEVPFLSGSFTNTGTGNNGSVNPFQTIERKDVGLKLAVTPQINEGDTIKLKIKLESSNVISGGAGTSALVTAKRTITNTVNVESGQVLVLGGLIDDNVNDSVSGVPLLSSIPVIGNLFKSRTISKTKRNLVVFIHPTILRGRGDGDFFTRRKYDSVRNLQIGRDAELPLIGGRPTVLPEWEQYLLNNNLPPAPTKAAISTRPDSSSTATGAANPSAPKASISAQQPGG